MMNTEYWFMIAVAAVALAIAVLLIVRLTRNSNKEVKKAKEKIKFDVMMERVEKRHYKKCKKCGQDVPVDEHICMSCGQIPD